MTDVQGRGYGLLFLSVATQVFLPRSVPGREQPVTVAWLGNTVQRVSPKGQYLPMFGGERQDNGE